METSASFEVRRAIVLPDRAPRALPGGRLDAQNANVIL